MDSVVVVAGCQDVEQVVNCSRWLDVVRVVVAKEKQVDFHSPVINVVAWGTR